MDAYVINLDRRKDRLAEFRRDHKRYGVPTAERFPAIEVKKSNGHIDAGQYGTYLSHRAIWERVKQNTLIFEDDAKPMRQFILPDLPGGFDLFYLGGNHKHFGAKAGRHISTAKIGDQVTGLYRCRQSLAIHAYIISPQGAEKALKLSMEYEGDKSLWQVQALGNSYYIAPSMFVQRASYSDLHKKWINFEGLT